MFALCIFKSWCETLDVLNDSSYVTNGCEVINQIENKHKGGSLFFVFFKLIAWFSIGLNNKILKNTILNLDYDISKTAKGFITLVFNCVMIPTINRVRCVTIKTAATI